VPATAAPGREPGIRRKGYTVILALLLFAALAATPAILHALHLKISTAPPTTSDGIRLLGAPHALTPVPLPATARPVDPAGPPAALPGVSESQEAAAVAAEDNRLRAMLHDSFRTFQPTIERWGHALPTLVLPAGSHYTYYGGYRVLVSGQSVYTTVDLIRDGALRLLPDGAALLVDNVFVASGVQLQLSSSIAASIYLEDAPSGSASIVAWGGNLQFQGTAAEPLTLEGWDEATMSPARDTGSGRPYIREVAGRMTLANVQASALGFWSGRTGGVAWTGLANHPSFGAAVGSTFRGDTYGAFVTRGHNVRFLGDLFEGNQLDGLHVHRGSAGASASYSAAVRNGANGFHVDRATLRTILQHDMSEHNATNGFLVDGRPLVSTASASGNGVAPGQGTRIEYSAASGNGRTGILIEGGNRTVLKADEVCAKLTGIALRYNASNAILDANDVRCGPRTGIRIGPQAPGALVFGNAVSGARIAMLVISPGGNVEIDKSLITLTSVFGISVRGVNSIVSGKDNVISGIGFRAVDSRAEATAPALSGSNTANWAFARKGTVLTYLQFHPLAVFWLSVAFLVIVGCLWTRRRRAPAHPYPESTRWRGFDAEPEPVPVPFAASVGTPVGAAPVAVDLAPASALAGAPASLGGQDPAGYLDRLDQLNQLDPLGAADERAGLGAAGERLGPPWSLSHDARPERVNLYRAPYAADGVPGYRGPFEAALPDAARLDGQHLDAGPLDALPPGGHRREDARLDQGSPDVPRRDAPRRDGGSAGGRRREDRWVDPGPLDAPRRDAPSLNGGSRIRGPLDGGPLDGRPLDGGPLDGGPLDGGPLDGGPLDGGRLDRTRRDSGRRDAARRDSGRRDNGGRDSGRRDNGGRDNGGREALAPGEGGPLDDRRLNPQGPEAEQFDPAALEDAQPYAGQSDVHRPSSRHGRSDPIDSTKPLPQVGDPQ
jgi:hypothetical protein